MGEIQPLVSVIMLAYNSEKNIGKGIVEQYAKSDVRIKLLE